MQAADEKAGTYGGCGPRLNEEQDPSEVWLEQAGLAEGQAGELRSPRARPSTTMSS